VRHRDVYRPRHTNVLPVIGAVLLGLIEVLVTRPMHDLAPMAPLPWTLMSSVE